MQRTWEDSRTGYRLILPQHIVGALSWTDMSQRHEKILEFPLCLSKFMAWPLSSPRSWTKPLCQCRLWKGSVLFQLHSRTSLAIYISIPLHKFCASQSTLYSLLVTMTPSWVLYISLEPPVKLVNRSNTLTDTWNQTNSSLRTYVWTAHLEI